MSRSMPRNPPLVLVLAAALGVTACSLLACGAEVTVYQPGPGGSSHGGSGTAGPGGGGQSAGHGPGGEGVAPVPPCGSTAMSCSSWEYPEGESCADCFCRCCNEPALMAQCMADPACAEYVTCLRTCASGPPCASSCQPPCDTGNEPGCYVMDCHNWTCEHACGLSY